MADIFISYTAADSDWAFRIAKELEVLGHIPHVHEWEIAAGGDISRWMEERHDSADHILCVVSEAYLNSMRAGNAGRPMGGDDRALEFCCAGVH
jgi:hypothetical protein